MRHLPWIVAILVLVGCETKTSYPLQICSVWEDEACTAGFDCIGFRCIQDCTYEGDCDLGFRCVDGQCLQSCDATDDCTIGTCVAVGNDRPGSACALRELPDCATDEHCGWGVCDDGQCLARCDWEGACGTGQTCDFRRDEYGACVDDPDYVPPPPPSSCQDAVFPDNWCKEQTGRNSFCDATTCRNRYAALLILDETLPAVCTADDPAPGTDLLGVRILSANGTYVTVHVSGEGAGNENMDVTVLNTTDEPSCDAAWLSLGCGGALVVVGGGGPMYPGEIVEISTQQNWCSNADSTFASAYLCDEFPADLDTAYELCGVYMGPVQDGYLTVPE